LFFRRIKSSQPIDFASRLDNRRRETFRSIIQGGMYRRLVTLLTRNANRDVVY
jgi:hypothetical protein